MYRSSMLAALALVLALGAPLAAQTLRPPERELGPLPAGEFEFLAPSPDGRFVAMTEYPRGEPPTLWLFDRTTRESTVLARGNDFESPTWSPRGGPEGVW